MNKTQKNIDIHIIEKKLEIICLNSEYEDCKIEENKLFNQLYSIESYIEYLEDKINNINYKKQEKFITDNLTDEQIKNVQILIKDEN